MPGGTLEVMYHHPYHTARYGQSHILGTVGNTLASQFVSDPAVQQALVRVEENCKNKAKVGVTEWMQENWHWLVVGGASLVAANYIMLSVAVLPYLGRNRS